MFSGFLRGISTLYDSDLISQEHYLTVLGEKVRGLPFDIFKKYQAFFVPNNEYLRNMWGEACTPSEYEIYSVDGFCSLNNCIVFPCFLLSSDVVGWVAFDPFVKAKAIETGEYGESYYSYPSKRLFNKSDYLFVLPEVYKKSLHDQYIVVTDGIFDTVSLTHYGVNACSLLGSSLTEKAAFPLQFISRIYVSLDNDEAGLKMLDNVRKLCPSARYIKQGSCNDIDDLLKTDRCSEFISKILSSIEYGLDLTFR